MPVDEGSILGPLLCILYINDITNTSTLSDFILFADDTTILFSSDDMCSEMNKINQELSERSNWFRANKLSVNASETNYMRMGTPEMTMVNNTGGNESENFDIILDDVKLARVNNTKFLGVIIDENLTWKIILMELQKQYPEISVWWTNLSSLFLSVSFELCIVLWYYHI